MCPGGACGEKARDRGRRRGLTKPVCVCVCVCVCPRPCPGSGLCNPGAPGTHFCGAKVRGRRGTVPFFLRKCLTDEKDDWSSAQGNELMGEEIV